MITNRLQLYKGVNLFYTMISFMSWTVAVKSIVGNFVPKQNQM